MAGRRGPWAVPPGTADSVLARWEPGDTLAALAGRAAADHGPGGARSAVLRLLWEQRLTADLHLPLDGGSVLEPAGG